MVTRSGVDSGPAQDSTARCVGNRTTATRQSWTLKTTTDSAKLSTVSYVEKKKKKLYDGPYGGPEKNK